VVDIFQLTMTA